MSTNDVLQTADKQALQYKIKKWGKFNFYSVILTVALCFACLIELSLIDVVPLKFTVIFISVAGCLTAISAICWFFSNRKLSSLKKLLPQENSEQ